MADLALVWGIAFWTWVDTFLALEILGIFVGTDRAFEDTAVCGDWVVEIGGDTGSAVIWLEIASWADCCVTWLTVCEVLVVSIRTIEQTFINIKIILTNTTQTLNIRQTQQTRLQTSLTSFRSRIPIKIYRTFL